MRITTQIGFVISAAAMAVTTADAAFVLPTSWTRGASGTTHQEWGTFTATTNQAPDVSDVNANGTASLSENGGNGAFITSGGNIYSFSGTTSFTVGIPEADIPTPPHDVTATVQFETLGSELDYSSVLLNGLNPISGIETSRTTISGGFGGEIVESWFLFNIPYSDFGDGTGPDVEDLTLTFNASGTSMSLDKLSIDTAIQLGGYYDEPFAAGTLLVGIPEPSITLLGGLGLLALLRRRR